jgi:hypothetical protein
METQITESVMLQADLNANDYRVAHAVTESCARFGHISSVRVHRKPAPFALIEMVNREHAYELAFQFGGSMFGNCVLVHLEPMRKAA